MKAIIACLLIVALGLQAATVDFDLSDFITGAIKRRTVYITPLSTPRTNATSVITSDSLRFYTDTSGQFSATNVQYGNYQVTILGPFTNTVFTILVPDDANTYDVIDLITTTNSVPSESVGYSQSAANARFVLRTDGWATNLTVTNIVLNPGFATNGYVWTANGTNGAGYWATNSGSGVASTAYLQLEDGDLLEPE